MKPAAPDIDAIVIASPCSVPWESMTGDAVRRYCGQCRLHVHDFSQMTRREITDLLVTSGGNCCKRIWRRPDGRVITKDCAGAVRSLRRRLARIASLAAGLLAVVGLGGCGGAPEPDGAATGKPAPAAPEKPPPPETDATVTTGR